MVICTDKKNYITSIDAVLKESAFNMFEPFEDVKYTGHPNYSAFPEKKDRFRQRNLSFFQLNSRSAS